MISVDTYRRAAPTRPRALVVEVRSRWLIRLAWRRWHVPSSVMAEWRLWKLWFWGKA